jgi:5'-nucleotidase
MRKMRVLITNDDGIEAAGLLALEAALLKTGADVLVAAPDRERSAASHSMSLGQTLKIFPRGPGRFAITGTPVDNVHLAVRHLFRDRLPDLVLSGINRGANMGCDVNYSGTVAGAREAVLLGLPAIAVSVELTGDELDYGPAAAFAAELARFVHEVGLPERTLLNVNVPDLPADKIRGARLSVQGRRRYNNFVDVWEDERGEMCCRFGGMVAGGVEIPGSDIMTLAEGYIAITPFRLDYTDGEALDWLAERWPAAGLPWE